MQLLPPKKYRVNGKKYIYRGNVRIWDGKTLKCTHDNQIQLCRKCNGSQVCQHNRQRSRCKECGGSSICIHNKRKTHCIACKGSQICVHNKRKETCKECKNIKQHVCKTKNCEFLAEYQGHCYACYVLL